MAARMRQGVRRAVLALLVVTTSWLMLSAAPGEKVEQGDPALADRLSRELSAALAEGASTDDLRLQLGCLRGESFQALEVFGRGIGIWNDESQFDVPPKMVRELLLAVRAADFAWMEESYGGRKDRASPALELTGEAEAAVRLVCRLSVSLGGVEKTVSQLLGGRQHEPLTDLAARLFEISEAAAADGVRAESLEDALRKVSRGDLAPETFRLVVVRADDEVIGDDRGWMMEVEGLEVRVRPNVEDGGLGEQRLSILTVPELAELTEMLADSAFDELPRGLFATRYTDVGVKILSHQAEVEARHYRGLENKAQQEERRRFDGIMRALTPLAERTLAGQS